MKKKIISIIKLALPYLILLLFPMISILYLESMLLDNYKEKLLMEKQKQMEFAFEKVVQEIDAVEDLANIMMQNDKMLSYVYTCMGKREHRVIDSIELKDVLINNIYNSKAMMAYYYDKVDNRVISSTTALSDANDYFRYTYKVKSYNPDEYKNRLDELGKVVYEYGPSMDVIIQNKAVKVIECYSTMPLNSGVREQKGCLVYVLDVKDIFADLYEIMEDKDEFHIYDGEGRFLFRSSDYYSDELLLKEGELAPVEDNGETIYGMSLTSADGEWNVKMYQTVFEEGNVWDMEMSHVLVIFSLAVSIILCSYLTIRNYRDIQKVLELFGRKNKNNEYNLEALNYKNIWECAERIIRENHEFEERINTYAQSHRSETLEKLLRNGYEGREEIDAALSKAGIVVEQEECVVLSIRYTGYDYRVHISENMTMKDMVKELIGGLLEQRVEIFDTAAKETVCILFFKKEADQEMILRDIVSKLKIELVYNCGIALKIAVGGMVDSLYEISTSYLQIKEVFHYVETSGQEVNLYTDMKELEKSYYSRADDEKIFNYVALGNSEEAKKIVEKIYNTNFNCGEEIPSTKVFGILKLRLYQTISEIAEKHKISMEKDLQELNLEQDILKFFGMIYSCLEKIAEEISSRNEALRNHTVMDIVSYVNQNYCSSSLCLKEIAREFSLNENYVSTIFSKAYGTTFSQAVETLRINKACELISEMETTIGEISEMVGYTSDASFRRAFKKVTGKTPREYKDQK